MSLLIFDLVLIFVSVFIVLAFILSFVIYKKPLVRVITNDLNDN